MNVPNAAHHMTSRKRPTRVRGMTSSMDRATHGRTDNRILRQHDF